MSKAAQQHLTQIKIVLITVVVLVIAIGFLLSAASQKAAVEADSELAFGPGMIGEVQRPYSKFSHDIKQHRDLDCSHCHSFPSANWKSVRPAGDAFPDITDYPKHASCINCHRQQFFRGASPAICSICHTSPSPRNSTRHPFPNPREAFDKSPKGKAAISEFSAHFNHELHLAMMSGNFSRTPRFIAAALKEPRLSEASCASCHQTLRPQGDSDDEYVVKPPADLGDGFWLKRGTFMSSSPGHASCFTCHSTDMGIEPAPSNCAACHKPAEKGYPVDFHPSVAARMGVNERALLDPWRTRTSSGTFRHEFPSHAEISCTTCHNTSALITTDRLTKKVSITNCNYCHITSTLDEGGILNYEIDQRSRDPKFQCIKCHLNFGSGPIPESHFKAIADL
jgi:hypothetical protein